MGQNVSCLVTIFIITPIGGPGNGAAVTLDNKEAIETQIIERLNTVTPPEKHIFKKPSSTGGCVQKDP